MNEKNYSLLEVFEKAGTLKTYTSGSIIYYQKEEAECFFFIKSGRVRTFLMDDTGADMTIEILGAGRVFGESSMICHLGRMTSVEAVTDTVLISCDLDQLKPWFYKEPQCAIAFIELLAKTISNLTLSVKRLTLMDASQKVADFLLSRTEAENKDLNLHKNFLPYSHQEIANCLSLQRVSVSRILKNLEKKGWIECGYKGVRILKRKEMEEFAYKYF